MRALPAEGLFGCSPQWEEAGKAHRDQPLLLAAIAKLVENGVVGGLQGVGEGR